jgi:hypothetical protein
MSTGEKMWDGKMKRMMTGGREEECVAEEFEEAELMVGKRMREEFE